MSWAEYLLRYSGVPSSEEKVVAREIEKVKELGVKI